MKKDLEYYNDCLDAKFFIYKDKVLVSDIVNLPSDFELKMKNTNEIERKYNHFHICFISSDIEEQKKFAINIWERWRKNLTMRFPHEQIEIQITDDGHEIILWVYRLAKIEQS